MAVQTRPVGRTGNGESVLTRALRILEAFGPDRPALRVTDVAARTGLHVATASRLVGELVAHGLLERDADRRVRPGLRLWELASRASPALSLREAAMPLLADLHAAVGHHVQLGVRDGVEVLFVERLSAPGSVINYTRIAGRLPLHASSSGLVLLAHAPAELQERVLSSPLPAFTPATITRPDRLRSTLATIRARGVAICAGHIHPEALGVAVPVRTAGTVAAAVAAIVPNDDRGQAVVPALQAAAYGIARRLSHSTREPS